MKRLFILYLLFCNCIIGYTQDLFHKIANSGQYTEFPVSGKILNTDSNYIIFRNGSYTCNQYVSYHESAWDLSQKTKACFILLFDDNDEDTSLYMSRSYNNPLIKYRVIVNHALYKQMNIPDNSFSLGFVEKGILKKKCNVTELANIKIADKKDSIKIESRFSAMSSIFLLNDSLLYASDPSINQQICIENFRNISGNKRISLNNENYFWLVDSIYNLLYKNEMSDFNAEKHRQLLIDKSDKDSVYARENQFKMQRNICRAVTDKGYIYQTLMFDAFKKDNGVKSYTLPVYIVLKLDFNLKIIDYYIFEKFELHNGSRYLGFYQLLERQDNKLLYKVMTENPENYSGFAFASFKLTDTHVMVLDSVYSFTPPNFMKSFQIYKCGHYTQIISGNKVLIGDIPYLYNINDASITDTISDKYAHLDSNIFLKNGEWSCFTGLFYHSIPTDKNGFIIYKKEKNKAEINSYLYDKAANFSLVFTERKYVEILGYYNNTLYLFDKINIDGKIEKYIYKQKIY